MKLRNLSLLTTVLFVISISIYINENKRGTDLLAGSDFVKGLDIGTVQKINLSFPSSPGKEKITLTRDSNRFLLENYQAYPAASDKVNDLIYKIASVQVKEKVLSNAKDDQLAKYLLNPKLANFRVELIDNSGKKTVSFLVGKKHKTGGNFLIKEGSKDVYLSQDSLWINSSYKELINTVLLKVKPEEIEKVKLKTDKNLQFIKKDNEFVAVNDNKIPYKKEKIKEYTQSFRELKFDDFLSVSDPKAKELEFKNDVQIHLKNKLIYKVDFAKKQRDHYIKLSALLDEAPTQFVVSQNDKKEDLQKIEDTINAQTQAQKINRTSGTWLYKVDKTTFEKLVKPQNFFL